MPFLIRIILQRILILLYSFLAFIGLAPEATIPTEEEARISIEERQEAIGDFFNDEGNQDKIENVVDGSKKVIEELNKIDLNKINELNKNPGRFEEIISETIRDNQINEGLEDLNRTPKETPNVSSNNIEDVTVNIVCSSTSGNLINVSTGSGVIIDPKGVIMTNAHVGQFVLLEDYYRSKNKMDCGIYRENIPTFGYTVDILYISPDWIRENSNLINSPSPRGTGEFDYALLYITGSTNPTFQKPRKFPYSEISLLDDNYEKNNSVEVSGYPGAPKNIIDIARAGILKTDIVLIKDVFTFNDGNIDIFSTTKTNVGARGASGGGAFLNDNLIGIISTTNGEQNNAEINALTTTYINTDIKNNTGKSIKSLLSNDPVDNVKDFSNKYGYSLFNILIEELDN